MMKSVFKWLLRTVLALVVLVVILLVTGFCLVNSNSVQNELVRRAKTMLQDKLQTRVDIDSVSINLVTLNAELYGLYVEDRQQRPLLRANLLKVKADASRASMPRSTTSATTPSTPCRTTSSSSTPSSATTTPTRRPCARS